MEYHAEITPLMQEVNNLLINVFEGMDHCILSYPRNLIVEVPKGYVADVVRVLSKSYEDVVDIKRAYSMIGLLHGYILVKPMISEAPLSVQQDVPSPTIEKLLVDTISDKEYIEMGADFKIKAFQKAFEQYEINHSRLLRYASRKGKKDEITLMLEGLNQSRINTVHNICSTLANTPVLKAWIFGSFARMEERPDSDIDILVELDKSESMGLFAFSALRDKLEVAAGRPIDLVAEGSLRPYARKSVDNDKVLVYERA